MRSFFVIIAVSLLFSCARNNILEPNSEPISEPSKEILSSNSMIENIANEILASEDENNKDPEIEWIAPENDVTGIILIDFINIFAFRNSRNALLAEKLRYYETVLPEDATLYGIDGDENSAIETITAGTEIIILARSNSRNDQHYLIKTADDDNLWSGWIKRDSISNQLNEEINDTRTGEKFSYMLLANVSVSNDTLAVHTAWMGEFIVVKKTGKFISRILDSEIIKVFPDAVDGNIIGWSTDQTKVWFYCNMDAYVASFGIIDIATGKYALFERPPSYCSYQKAINFDTGDIYYTDYPFQFDTESAKATKKSGKIFHLYSYNFFSRELTEIGTNPGEGFQINFDKINGFSYEKNDYYS